ncbi:MAG: carbohydrate ABC transporter permease [Microthrixaceae bacterium]|nr:carbohydrate ABC transporter permease [Microthrixaceae bacterium]MCB9386252.1 carbohydrate ABC transporter permease [Microthrixaceae bacterium]
MATESTVTAPPTAVERPRPPRSGLSIGLARAGWYISLTLLAVVVLFPIYMLVIRAISDPISFINAGQPLHIVSAQWDVFSRAWSDAGLARAMGVSAVATIVIMGAQFMTSVLGAYAFAFLEFPLKKLLFAIVIGTLLLPIEVTLVANIQTVRSLGWLNSVQGLTFPFLATALGIFLIRQGFLGLPRDLRDAATLDGFGHIGFLFKVAIPLAKPVIGSFLVISFLSAWNQYVWPRNATTEGAWQTVQIALRTLTTTRVDQINLAFAGAIIAALPLVLLLIFFQRQMVRGLTAGAVKG